EVVSASAVGSLVAVGSSVFGFSFLSARRLVGLSEAHRLVGWDWGSDFWDLGLVAEWRASSKLVVEAGVDGASTPAAVSAGAGFWEWAREMGSEEEMDAAS